MFRKDKTSTERRRSQRMQACTENMASWRVDVGLVCGEAPGYAVGRAGGVVILSTGHPFGTEQLHPLGDCGFTLWQEG